MLYLDATTAVKNVQVWLHLRDGRVDRATLDQLLATSRAAVDSLQTLNEGI